MIQESINKIISLCDTLPSELRGLSQLEFNFKPVGKWSKKEILGHLVDSAFNNLQRFIRGQIEDRPMIGYDQDKWVSIQQYQDYEDENLIVLWESVNRHLIHVISHISMSELDRVCLIREGTAVSLGFLIIDYSKHLQHHIMQLRS